MQLIKGQILSHIIEDFDEQLFRIRTADAEALVQHRLDERKDSPESFPQITELCPHSVFISRSKIVCRQSDYIESTQPVVYIARSSQALNNLRSRLPNFDCAINFINPSTSQSGVYCTAPLFLRQGFKIQCEENLTILGEINLPRYNILINCNETIWTFGLQIRISTLIIIRKNYYNLQLAYPIENNKKPDAMYLEDWHDFLTYGSPIADYIFIKNSSR